MKKQIIILTAAIAVLTAGKVFAHDDDTDATTHSTPGSNLWNQSVESTNWMYELKQVHGHVGPWNVLGWRMGKAALRVLNATWGQHELDIVCCIPLKTPYSCIADGLVVGTGNSIGRLDIRLAEALAMSDAHISIRRKDGTGPVLLLKPVQKYMDKIRKAPDAQLESLARECGELPEGDLFLVEKAPPAETSSQ